MRFLFALTFLIIPTTASAQQSDPEKLFRSMEAKLRQAKGIKVAFQLIIDNNNTNAGKMSGAVYVLPGNKARIDVSGTMEGKEVSSQMVADGNQSLYKETLSDKQPEPKPVEPLLSQALPQFIARGGVFVAMNAKPPKDNFDIDKAMPVATFKLGNKDKVGIRDTQIVECDLKIDDEKVVRIVVWLDTVTNFPLQRKLTVESADKKTTLTVTEIYTEFTINPQLDQKLFVLPK